MNADEKTTSKPVPDADLDQDWTADERAALSQWRALAPEVPADHERFFDRLTERILIAEAAEARGDAQTPQRDERDVREQDDDFHEWRRAVPSRLRAALAFAAFAVVSAAMVSFAMWYEATHDEERPQPSESARPTKPSAPQAPELDASLERSIGSYLADYGRNWGDAFSFHGSIVITARGETVYAQSFGLADRERGVMHDLDTRFALGTLTEPFTALAIFQLRDAGKLDLDEPIAKFLPDFPDASSITIRHLLRHRSGLPNYTDAPYFSRWKAQPQTTEKMLGRLAGLELEFAPGEEFSLSNSGYYLLGVIVERASGRSYAQYLADQVFAPANMTRSSAQPGSTPIPGYVWRESPPPIAAPTEQPTRGDAARPSSRHPELMLADTVDTSVYGAAGVVTTTPRDLASWSDALFSGRLLAAASVAEMLTPDASHFGYGWFVNEAHGQRVVNFAGAIDGFSSAVLWFERDDVAIHVLANNEVLHARSLALDIASILYGEPPPRREEPAAIERPPAALERFVGTYTLATPARKRLTKIAHPEWLALFDRVEVLLHEGELYFDIARWGSSKMHPMTGDAFFFKDHSGTTLSFELGMSGRPARLIVRTRDAQLEFWPLPAASEAPRGTRTR